MTPPTTQFSASDWLRDNIGASIEAKANLEEYTQIDVVVTEKGKPDRKGTAWDFDDAVARAVGAEK